MRLSCVTIFVQNWQIYVDQSKPSLDRGASMTLDAFCSLSPPDKVQVISAVLPKSNKKTPWIRCISKIPGRSSIDVANVDSVDKVYRILTKHLQIQVWMEIRCVSSCNLWRFSLSRLLAHHYFAGEPRRMHLLKVEVQGQWPHGSWQGQSGD